MLDDEDINLSLSPVRKSAPRQGRRALLGGGGSQDITTPPMGSPLKGRLDSADINLDSDTSVPLSRKSAPPRRAGGWADENSRTPTRPETAYPSKSSKGDSSDEDVPVIPDLEEVEQENMAQRVAEAPSVAVNRVATYKELDSDLFKHAAFATLDDIDLRKIIKLQKIE